MRLKNVWKINFFCRFAPCFSPFHAGELGQAPPGLKETLQTDWWILFHCIYRLLCRSSNFSLICHGFSLWEVIRILVVGCAMDPIRGPVLAVQITRSCAVGHSLSDQRIMFSRTIHGWHAIILALLFAVYLFPKTFSHWRRVEDAQTARDERVVGSSYAAQPLP